MTRQSLHNSSALGAFSGRLFIPHMHALQKLGRVILLFIVLLALSQSRAFSAPSQTPEASAVIQEINRKLNEITEFEADFLQIFDDGSRASGRLYVKKPGRLRMEYAPPHNGLVIAGGQQLAVFDPLSDGGFEQFPIAQTPLSVLLRPSFDISPFVEAYHAQGNEIWVSLHSPTQPDSEARLTVWFSKSNAHIKRWVLRNELGERIEIRLSNIVNALSIGDNSFNIALELERRKP